MGQEGVNGLTLAEVARRLGVQPPSIYKYFASIGAVYDALFARAASENLAVLREGMTALLHELAVPTDLYAVGRGNGGPDQTLSGDVGVDLPLAGHEPDGATGDLVIRTGLSALWGMVDKGGTKPSGRVVPVDG